MTELSPPKPKPSDAPPASEPPPDLEDLRLPRPALRVGVIGGRKLGTTDGPPPWLPERLKNLFGLIGSELSRLQQSADYFDKTTPPLLRIVSGLADGADQIGARAALA